ncbi:MAG TPA: PAS domain-containing protein, partial [Herpetosiphonaceae bacterium]|nr:PAS domain-containing protein [Herpetosiphonaceae bacterium]
YCGVPYEPTTAAEIAASFLHPDDAWRVMAAFGEAMRTGTSFEIEQRNRSAAGDYRWFLNRANPYRDPQTGKIVKWLGVGIDIHERKLAEEALRESEARFRAVADLVPDLLWSSDPRGARDWYNRRWLDYTGQSLAEARGYGWLDAIHPDDRERSSRNFQAAIKGGEPLRQEHRIRGADGEYRWFLVQAQLLRDEAGHIVRWYGAATDIHNERIALERAQAAQAEAEGALQARDAFMSMVSHDLKQPLGVIQAYADLAQRRLRRTDTVPLERIADSIGKIEAAARRMTESINELLDVSHLRAGQLLDLEVRPTDLVALVQRVVAEQQETTERHRLHVTAPISELVGDYDATRLERVLVNLLSNAIKYSPEGGAITISVMQEVDGAAAWSVIQVRDEGMGIPAADLPYIFERFRRGTNVMGQIGGSGIGLASAQQIVEQHGGTIGVKSVEGRGTTFTVRLPVVAHEAV